MSQGNQISLYKKINKSIIEKSQLTISRPNLSYHADNMKKEIDLTKCENKIIVVNEFDDQWTPSDNDLIFSTEINIMQPQELFGEAGVTLKSNTLGVAVHLHSKSSFFQKTINIGEITYSEKEISIPFNYIFDKDYLRGEIQLDFYIYLKDIYEQYDVHANIPGMIVSDDDLFSYNLILDGIGSVFPITEFQDKNGPLWKVNKNWTEAEFDPFNINYVSLSLNTAHPIFKFIKEEKTAISRSYMNDIIGKAMTMIVNEVINVEKLSLAEKTNNNTESIFNVVCYWIETFNINTTDIFTISESIQKYLNSGNGDV